MSLIVQRIVNNTIAVKKVKLISATKEYAEDFKVDFFNNLNGYNKVVIDLSKCEVIDSTFVSALAAIQKNKNRHSLKLVASHPDVQSVLELTGILKIFETFKTVKEAVSSFKS